MKYVGKNGLRVADKKVWHEGNFDPSSKSDTGHAHTIDSVLASGNSSSRSVSIGRYLQQATGVPTSNLGSPTVTEMALFDSQFDNKTWFYPPSMFTFEYTNDGINWITQSIAESTIKNFVSGRNNASISIPNGCKQYRIRIDNKNSYAYINALYMYFSTGGNNTTVKISKKRDDGDWVQHTSSGQTVSSWPGHLYLPFSTIPWSRASTSGHYRYVEILFTPNWNHATNNITLYGLEFWGGYPAGSRSLFSWDGDKNATFPAELKATTFKKTNGAEVAYKDDIPTSLPADGGNAATVNGKTVAENVPAGAKFTDTTYSEISTTEIDTGTASTLRAITARRLKYITDKIQTLLNGKVNNSQVLTDVPANAKFTDTVYTHPASHPPGIIAQDASNRFVTDTEKANWNGKQAAITGAATTIASANLATSRALVSDSSGKVAVSAVTATQLGYVSGVTSAIQTQINGKAATTHTHTKSQITDMPTNLSQFVNDIGAGAGIKISTNATAPTSPTPGDFWYKEL